MVQRKKADASEPAQAAQHVASDVLPRSVQRHDTTPVQNQKNGVLDAIVVGPQNDAHFRAKLSTGEFVLVRHRDPSLFPQNFKLQVALLPGSTLYAPVKTPRWRGKW